MGSTLSVLFATAAQGDALASEQLFQALYAELHRLAKRELWRSGGAVTLGATTLVHEAFLQVSGREGIPFPDRARFMGYTARAIRGLIIDYARQRHAQKRGGGFEITALDTDVADNVRRRRLNRWRSMRPPRDVRPRREQTVALPKR